MKYEDVTIQYLIDNISNIDKLKYKINKKFKYLNKKYKTKIIITKLNIGTIEYIVDHTNSVFAKDSLHWGRYEYLRYENEKMVRLGKLKQILF